ncbi:MAG: Autotransporter-associated beta strand repeat protein, partial [Verrucomicrobiales bacterium]|nr:Autotransporter-associated beta strand repeat protein [Verrucomicrobiales bacterium]
LDVNDFTPGAQPVTVSGAGVGGLGAIMDTTTATAVGVNFRDVTMAADTTFGGAAGRWDIRVRNSTGAGPGLRGNGFNLTKEGAGFVSIACQRDLGVNTPYWNMNLGNIVINAGTLALAESLTVGNPAKTITINSGAAIQVFDLGLTNPLVRNIFVSDGKINGSGASTDTNVFTGTINATGTVSIRPDQCVMFFNGPITGSAAIAASAVDPGRIYLNGANTFAGNLTVTNGTIGGNGSITGSLIMQAGTLAPGQMDVLGTFSVGGNATLAGTNLMEINRAASPNSDRLNVGGTLAFGGILKVVLGVGAASPQAGDVYQLFSKGSATSFSSIVLPDLSALPGGLSWNTTNLAVNGSISVSGTGPANPPTITSASISGANFVFSGTGGTQGNNYIVLTTTNVAAGITNWTKIATNQFQAGGTFSVTNVIAPNAPASFYELQVP